jgi:hypothetical protein
MDRLWSSPEINVFRVLTSDILMCFNEISCAAVKPAESICSIYISKLTDRFSFANILL